MLQYERIDVSGGIDIDKADASKECMLCHYWYFKDVGLKFESNVCMKCYDVSTTAYKLKNISILNVKRINFRCILWRISRNEAIDNSVLKEIGVL